jgi:ABC-type antimicrobial peptide transport system permease subunit
MLYNAYKTKVSFVRKRKINIDFMTMKDDPKKQIQLDNIHQINMKNLESKYSNSKKNYSIGQPSFRQVFENYPRNRTDNNIQLNDNYRQERSLYQLQSKPNNVLPKWVNYLMDTTVANDDISSMSVITFSTAVDTSCKFITVFCGIGVNEFLAKFSPPGMAVVVSIK